MFNLEFDPARSQHVLIVLGPKGFPTFKVIHQDAAYLEKMGDELVNKKESQFLSYKVIDSNNVFTLTNPDYRFDQALDIIIQNLILGRFDPMTSDYG